MSRCISGNGTFRPSFGTGEYQLHFCIDFQGANIQTAMVWAEVEPKNKTILDQEFQEYNQGGGMAIFAAAQGHQLVTARVVLSFMNAT